MLGIWLSLISIIVIRRRHVKFKWSTNLSGYFQKYPTYPSEIYILHPLSDKIHFVLFKIKLNLCCVQQPAVQIQDVTYRNIHGTSSTNVAVNFSCSKTVTCIGITRTNVKITSTTANKAKSVCANALGMASETIFPPSCLESWSGPLDSFRK